MGFGLSAFKKSEEAGNVRAESPYFRLAPGQKVNIRPLAELDEEAKNFDPKVGTANFVREYANPVKFWLSITQESKDSPNVGAEMVRRFGWYKGNGELREGQHSDKTKNWNPRQRFYLPVLVDRLDGSEPTTEVLQLTYGPKSYSQRFIEQHEIKETITDRWWLFKRNDAEIGKNGATMADVEYTLVPSDPSDLDTSGIEVPDVSTAPYVNNVPYDEQYDFLQISETYPDNVSAKPADTGATSSATIPPQKLQWN